MNENHRKNRFIRTPDLEKKIIEEYLKGFSSKEVLVKLGNPFKTEKSILDILKKNNIHIRTASEAARKIDRDSFYFSNIDKKEKAYILGLLITDGWILKDRNVFGFSSIDKELTFLIANQIANGSGITTIEAKKYVICGKEIQRKEAYQFQLNDNQLKIDLVKLGIQVEKSFNEFLPYVEESLMSHLLRGILDGDGCIYKLSNLTQLGINFYSGSKFFLKQISIYFWLKLRIPPPEITKSDTISKISYAQSQYVENILEYLYEDSEFLRLERKYNLWKKYESGQLEKDRKTRNLEFNS